MSTILRALKKLEQEKNFTNASRTSLNGFNARHAVGRPIRAAWHRARLIRWAGVTLCVAILATVSYLYFQSDEPAPKAADIAVSKPKDQTPWMGTAASRPPEPTTVKGEKSEVPPTAAPPRQDALSGGKERGIPKAAPAPPSIPAPMARQPAQGPPKEPSVSDNRVSPKPAPGGRTDRQPVDDPQKSSQQGAKQSDEAFVGAERMPDGRLKIQAIAWAPDPQERMAVIDNRILREGDSVGGYTIIAIAEDQILLSGEGRRWKIIFGRR